MKYKKTKTNFSEDRNIEVRYTRLKKENPYISENELIKILEIDLNKLNEIKERLNRYKNEVYIHKDNEIKIETKVVKFTTKQDKYKKDLSIIKELFDKYPNWSVDIMSKYTNISKYRIIRMIQENPEIKINEKLINENTVLDLIEKDMTLKEICKTVNVGEVALKEIIKDMGFKEQKRWVRNGK